MGLSPALIGVSAGRMLLHSWAEGLSGVTETRKMEARRALMRRAGHGEAITANNRESAGSGAGPPPGPPPQRPPVTRFANFRIGSETLVSGLSKAKTSDTWLWRLL